MTTSTNTDRQHGATDPLAVEWETLAARPASEREEGLQRFYGALAELPETDRLDRLRAVTATTYALPDDPFRALTESRLRVWLGMDTDAASLVARSYDAVLQELPANDAMRRVAVVQTLMRDLTDEDQRRLRRLNPEERARGLTLTRLGSFAEQADRSA